MKARIKSYKMLFGNQDCTEFQELGLHIGDIVDVVPLFSNGIVYTSDSGDMCMYNHNIEPLPEKSDVLDNVLMCNNCKNIWIAPKERCDCGSSALTHTHESNYTYAINFKAKSYN